MNAIFVIALSTSSRCMHIIELVFRYLWKKPVGHLMTGSLLDRQGSRMAICFFPLGRAYRSCHTLLRHNDGSDVSRSPPDIMMLISC